MAEKRDMLIIVFLILSGGLFKFVSTYRTQKLELLEAHFKNAEIVNIPGEFGGSVARVQGQGVWYFRIVGLLKSTLFKIKIFDGSDVDEKDRLERSLTEEQKLVCKRLLYILSPEGRGEVVPVTHNLYLGRIYGAGVWVVKMDYFEHERIMAIYKLLEEKNLGLCQKIAKSLD